MGKVLKAEGMSRCTGCFTCMLVCSAVNKNDHSISKSAIRIKTTGGVKGSFYANVCRACEGNISCLNACPTGAITAREGGGVRLEPSKCTACRKCIDACSVMAITFDSDEKLPIMCKQCGMCAKYCPHKCIVFEEKGE